jgi:hypothetical protein
MTSLVGATLVVALHHPMVTLLHPVVTLLQKKKPDFA